MRKTWGKFLEIAVLSVLCLVDIIKANHLLKKELSHAVEYFNYRASQKLES